MQSPKTPAASSARSTSKSEDRRDLDQQPRTSRAHPRPVVARHSETSCCTLGLGEIEDRDPAESRRSRGLSAGPRPPIDEPGRTIQIARSPRRTLLPITSPGVESRDGRGIGALLQESTSCWRRSTGGTGPGGEELLPPSLVAELFDPRLNCSTRARNVGFSKSPTTVAPPRSTPLFTGVEKRSTAVDEGRDRRHETVGGL